MPSFQIDGIIQRLMQLDDDEWVSLMNNFASLKEGGHA